ncbi:MAG TPA: SDR family oxidoreductase [Bryobacteraceae bacterium]|jgi:NAD(P)-dependent dehydrogenase (short-subunit alcohol dehydrogenase family)
MTPTLRGREIILAGGTGGLGAATASLLAEEGATLILGYHANHERAERVAQGAHLIQADLASEEDRTALLDAADDLYGLVILSGDPSRGAILSETLPRSFETNFAGPILLAREAADRMKTRGTPGAIVILGTMQTAALFTNSTAYAAQKAALVHAACVLAKEMRGPANIRVNVVNPGVTTAGMAQASVASGKYQPYLDQGAIARYGQAVDIARAIRFFLEPDNYVTGQVLTVDGGLTL